MYLFLCSIAKYVDRTVIPTKECVRSLNSYLLANMTRIQGMRFQTKIFKLAKTCNKFVSQNIISIFLYCENINISLTNS